MKQKFYATCAALAMSLCIPAMAQATVQDLGVLGVENRTFGTLANSGGFADFFQFTAGTDLSGAFAVQSVTFGSFGVSLSSLSVYSGTYASTAALLGQTPLATNSTPALTDLGNGVLIYALNISFPTFAASQPYTIYVSGNSAGSSAYTTTIAMSAAVAPVPEPAIWSLMIAGFAMIGASLRHRRQAPKVIFA